MNATMRRVLLLAGSCLVAGATATPVTADEPAETAAAAAPCAEREEFREFDFWIGNWDVLTAAGALAGHNRIEPALAGCVLIENWTGARGSSGMSMNYRDMASGKWVQVWTDAGGGQITIRGGLTDDGMLLEGQIHDVATGTTAPFRGLWTLLPDGRVRQFFEQSNDGGRTWEPWFEGFYVRANGDSVTQ
jgi:hypothetical protein